jgi:hypothetical protein
MWLALLRTLPSPKPNDYPFRLTGWLAMHRTLPLPRSTCLSSARHTLGKCPTSFSTTRCPRSMTTHGCVSQQFSGGQPRRARTLLKGWWMAKGGPCNRSLTSSSRHLTDGTSWLQKLWLSNRVTTKRVLYTPVGQLASVLEAHTRKNGMPNFWCIWVCKKLKSLLRDPYSTHGVRKASHVYIGAIVQH